VVQADLVDAKSGAQMWGKQYVRATEEIVTLQGQIAKDILTVLQMKLTGREAQAVEKRYTENSEAYTLYLKGRYHWNKFNAVDQKKAIEYFQKAIEMDPGYALAYTGLSSAYSSMSVNGWYPPQDGFTRAKAAAKKATELDPDLSDAHNVLAANYFFTDWNWAESEKEIVTAIRLSPDGNNHDLYSYLLQAVGRIEEAIREIELAEKVDPLSPLIVSDAGFTYYLARQYDKAISKNLKALELDPNYEAAHDYLAYIYSAKGDFPRAIGAAKKAVEVSRGSAIEVAALGYVYGRSGNKPEAEKLFSNLLEASKTQYVSPFYYALIHIGLDRKEEALAELQKAVKQRTGDWGLVFIKQDPLFDPLRSDPRFQQLLKTMQLL
jgi:tetratricopeptide (TPR) repeat protein